jgi:hypothetical protein
MPTNYVMNAQKRFPRTADLIKHLPGSWARPNTGNLMRDSLTELSQGSHEAIAAVLELQRQVADLKKQVASLSRANRD